jgi:hypothetical protein
MPGQAALLRFVLDRDKTHGGLAYSDGFGIVVVVFGGLAFAEGLHEFGGHQARLQAHGLHAPPPVVRGAARFHAHQAACWQMHQPFGQFLLNLKLRDRTQCPWVSCA